MTKFEFEKTFIHQVSLPNGRGGEYHQSAVEYVKSNFQSGTYSWVGMSFFFTKEKDAILFSLRWL